MSTTWEDPPEYRDGGGGGGGGGGPQIQLPLVLPMTKALLWSNVILFALTLLLGQTVTDIFALWPSQWVDFFPWIPFWQVLTYGFFHADNTLMHLLFNMLGIYFFGSMLEGLVGSRRYLAWYLAAVVLGGVAQLADGVVTAMGDPAAIGYTLGASGGVMFLIVACAALRPNTLVIFILFPLKLRTLALIWVGLDVFGLLQGGGGTAYLVHITGAAMGFAAVKLRWIWTDPLEKVQEHREAARERTAEGDKRRLDLLLKQIHEKGIGSLTKREKDFLKRMSSRK